MVPVSLEIKIKVPINEELARWFCAFSFTPDQ
jgi:hypothetical protein